MDVEIRESEIEDVFAQYPAILKRVLGISEDINLVARQKLLASGRLDLIYACLTDLLLVELKAEEFKKNFVHQVLSYRDDLHTLQRGGKFIHGNIVPYLVCPGFTPEARLFAERSGVQPRSYDPAAVLTEFYRNAPLDTRYLSVLPADKGVWRIGLSNQSLLLVEKLPQLHLIAEARAASPKTIGNQLRLAQDLGLAHIRPKRVKLSLYGEEFVRKADTTLPADTLSAGQADLLRKFILSKPFFSGVTFGILTIVACVFELSKNTYPVPLDLLSRHFISAAGLHFRWSKDKAISKGVRMYSNYAIELGLVGKIGSGYFVTPSGLKFVLLLNMHKSLKFIESLSGIE